jgi:molybdopterin biosynthesis enzyme
LFVRPAIAALAGLGFVPLESTRAKLSHSYDHAGGRAACLPARLSRGCPENLVEIRPWQGSADLAALARANGLVRLPTEKRRFEAGAELEVLPI